MSPSWWQSRDPDLGRDRTTKALGRRDWNWFVAYDGSTLTPADLEPARSPWPATTVTAKDRHDRTLGIPPRHITMWPHVGARLDHLVTLHGRRPPHRNPRDARVVDEVRRANATAVINELTQRLPAPSPAQVSPEALTRLLNELAPAVYARPIERQYTAAGDIARSHQLPTDAVMALARDTGTLIAKTTHTPAPDVPGDPALNRLAHADRALAAELLLARAQLTWLDAHSDPDLPRLWILVNALHHAVPPEVMLTTRAKSHGPVAAVVPEHDDLVGWHGIATAFTHLNATVTAARHGRDWLTSSQHGQHGPIDGTVDDRILALGVLHLTHPRTAHELARLSPLHLPLSHLRDVAASLPAPAHPIDLSDAALKAVCDRNGWLLGTADERTQRELVERHTRTALTEPHCQADLRNRLARGDTLALAAAAAHAPTDADLDRATWRHDPPATDTANRRRLLDLASREALHRFAGFDITPHPTRAAALTGRYPHRLARQGLHTSPGQLLHPATPDLGPHPYAATEQLDLGF
jgi:hypothetical protein